MFDADYPILNSSQDLLNRITFVKSLSRCMLDYNNPESLVIGLEGDWGSGKTSLINLAIEELNHSANNLVFEIKPIIINFNPWSYAEQNQIIYAFFKKLTSVIKQTNYLDHKEEILQLIELYFSYFIPKTLHPIFVNKKSLRTKIRNLILRYNKNSEKKFETDATLIKTKLNNLLKSQKCKIIIFIDNVEHVNKKELKQIFQLIKAIGDLHNTIYILAYNKDRISYLLSEEDTAYLDKMIQLPFTVPLISKQDLEVILLNRLQSLIKLVPENLWDSHYWADIYYSSLKLCFDNVRNITRYINTLNFEYSRVKDVVNPVDFFALTALSVFEPNVYDGIRDNKDLFTDLMNNVFKLDHEKLKEDKLRIDEIIYRSNKLSQSALKALLSHLFPRLKVIYYQDKTIEHSEIDDRKNKRINSADLFDAYFSLSLSSGSISDAELNAILESTRHKDQFNQTLLRLNKDNRVIKLLGLLDGSVNRISEDSISHVIDALFDNADLFPEEEPALFGFDTPMRVHRICRQLLQGFSAKQQFDLYHHAINHAKNSLYILVHEVRLLQSRDRATISHDHLVILQNLVSKKIASFAALDRLVEHPKLLALLYAWKEWGDKQECQNYVSKVTKGDRGLVAFLCAALSKPIDDALLKQEKNPSWVKSFNNITAFISAKDIEAHVKELFENNYFEKLREREQLAILIFLDICKADTLKVIPDTSNN